MRKLVKEVVESLLLWYDLAQGVYRVLSPQQAEFEVQLHAISHLVSYKSPIYQSQCILSDISYFRSLNFRQKTNMNLS